MNTWKDAWVILRPRILRRIGELRESVDHNEKEKKKELSKEAPNATSYGMHHKAMMIQKYILDGYTSIVESITSKFDEAPPPITGFSIPLRNYGGETGGLVKVWYYTKHEWAREDYGEGTAFLQTCDIDLQIVYGKKEDPLYELLIGCEVWGRPFSRGDADDREIAAFTDRLFAMVYFQDTMQEVRAVDAADIINGMIGKEILLDGAYNLRNVQERHLRNPRRVEVHLDIEDSCGIKHKHKRVLVFHNPRKKSRRNKGKSLSTYLTDKKETAIWVKYHSPKYGDLISHVISLINKEPKQIITV